MADMKSSNHAVYWAKWLKRQGTDFSDILAIDPYSHWSSFPRAHGLAETRFDFALWMALSHYRGSEGLAMAKMAVEICDRALAEKILRRGKNRPHHPFNEGLAHRCRAYATFLCGRSLQVTSLVESANCIVQWFSSGAFGKPVGDLEISVISALSSALMSGASTCIAPIRLLVAKFGTWKRHKKVLLALCDAATNQSNAQGAASDFLASFDKLFDQVRKPTAARTLLSFELACLRCWLGSGDVNKIALADVIDLLLY